MPGVLDTELVVGEARFELACHIGGVYSAGGYPVTLYSPVVVHVLLYHTSYVVVKRSDVGNRTPIFWLLPAIYH